MGEFLGVIGGLEGLHNFLFNRCHFDERVSQDDDLLILRDFFDFIQVQTADVSNVLQRPLLF